MSWRIAIFARSSFAACCRTIGTSVVLVAMWVFCKTPGFPPQFRASAAASDQAAAVIRDDGNSMKLRLLTAAELDAVLALNNTEVPRVSALTRPELEQLVDWSTFALVAVDGGHIAGVVLVLPPGRPYASLNYAFFSRRGANWRYVDRIVIGPDYRRQRLASELYDAVEAHARQAGCRTVVCEVNIAPENPVSLQFHGQRGYLPVGEQDTPGGVRVRLFERDVREG